jgi:hypothetical protein
MVLLCSKSEPAYDFQPGLLALPAIPTIETPLVAPVTLGKLAVDDRGMTYFIENDRLWMQNGDGTPTLHFTGQGAIRDLAVAFRNVYVVDGLGIRRVSDFGEAETVASGDYLAIALDGSDAYALTPTSIQRVNLAKAAVKTIASTDPKGDAELSPPLAVSNGAVFFGIDDGIGQIPKTTNHVLLNEPFSAISPSAFGVKPGGVLVATTHGITELGGKEPHVLTPDGWDNECSEVVVAGKYVYLTYLDGGGWNVGRIMGGKVDPVVHTAVRPGLTARGGTVLWSTPEGVRSAPEPFQAD